MFVYFYIYNFFFIDGPDDHIQAVIEEGIVHRMVELTSHHAPSVRTPALRTVGNIATGNEVQVCGRGGEEEREGSWGNRTGEGRKKREERREIFNLFVYRHKY